MSPGRAESNALLRGWCRDITGRVLSLGSGKDSDGDGSLYRRYFVRADEYLTSEPEPRAECDLVLDARSMPSIKAGSFDAVFCSGVLEHVDDYPAAVLEVYRVLKSGGTFLVGVPFAQPVHRAPQDFWRFTEFGVKYLLRAFVLEEMRAIGQDPKAPTAYWARVRKP